MKSTQLKPLQEEKSNTWSHLLGVAFTLSSTWIIWPSLYLGWQMALGVIFFLVGMFFMFLSSTLYHCAPIGRMKRILRKFDHISIYVMIACSYTPICIGVVGGKIGWITFGAQWFLVLLGTFYKIFALDKWPRLSLALYLLMGWSILLIMGPVLQALTILSICLLIAEGLFYTLGTYFFAHDHHPFFHTIWHIFVLLGAISHWGVVLSIIFTHSQSFL